MAEGDKNRPHGSRRVLNPEYCIPPSPPRKLYINGGDTRYIIASHSPVRDSIFFLSATTLFSSHSLGQEEEESRESFLHIPHLTLYAVFRGFYWKEWGHLSFLKMKAPSWIQANEFWMGWKISRRPRSKDGGARLRGVSLSFFFNQEEASRSFLPLCGILYWTNSLTW